MFTYCQLFQGSYFNHSFLFCFAFNSLTSSNSWICLTWLYLEGFSISVGSVLFSLALFLLLLKARGVVSAGNKLQVFDLKPYLFLAGDWVVFHRRYKLTCPGLPVSPWSLLVLLSKSCSKRVGILPTDSALHTHFALLMGFWHRSVAVTYIWGFSISLLREAAIQAYVLPTTEPSSRNTFSPDVSIYFWECSRLCPTSYQSTKQSPSLWTLRVSHWYPCSSKQPVKP